MRLEAIRPAPRLGGVEEEDGATTPPAMLALLESDRGPRGQPMSRLEREFKVEGGAGERGKTSK